jgi:deazaflavin-dependent oxidoreductase (nitroreductase family)
MKGGWGNDENGADAEPIMSGDASLQKLTSAERLFNKIFGGLVGLGICPRDYYLLEVVGRKSGRTYSTPVNLLEVRGKRFLVAPRGYTQWVRNAQAAGTVTLRKGSRRDKFHLRALSNEEKPEILKAYLDRFKITVQRYFPVSSGSPPAAFEPLVVRYPVFELLASQQRTRGEG